MTKLSKPSDALLTDEQHTELKTQWLNNEISHADFMWLCGHGEDSYALYYSQKSSRRSKNRNKATHGKSEYY
jgi:hypothetical protein